MITTSLNEKKTRFNFFMSTHPRPPCIDSLFRVYTIKTRLADWEVCMRCRAKSSMPRRCLRRCRRLRRRRLICACQTCGSTWRTSSSPRSSTTTLSRCIIIATRSSTTIATRRCVQSESVRFRAKTEVLVSCRTRRLPHSLRGGKEPGTEHDALARKPTLSQDQEVPRQKISIWNPPSWESVLLVAVAEQLRLILGGGTPYSSQTRRCC